MGAPAAPVGVLLALPQRVGAFLLALATQIGGVTILLGQILRRLNPARIDRHELFRNLNRMGVRSVPIISATAAFTGGIMVVQAAPFVEQFNAKGFIGWAATFTTFRELGPLLIGLIFNGRVGANNTAELGTMQVTDQVDALRALAIDPIAYLVVPRVLAMISMMVVLTILGDAIALGGAMLTADLLLDVDPRIFWASAIERLETWDFFVGLIKSLLFGVMIALMSCYYGLATRGGAPGVGRAVNASVVASAAGVFIADYFSTFVLD
ncbi:MAG TPA: ABC transporter permease [Polyangiaceae bacterium LLY-WYZ-15_(1-7)]|nr:ABC transporter permease [Myxococcales bacterium]MAT23519.1 ABC transporter permease [Sandaracinus sp.]HJK95104.1 ABC transporter permease [Polyangiaceae bacterium LLY-WYZ-15_(1-7)]MBJ73779.1 ABC transporter permease [Sandaracinus sp.]HJL02619.1 ABC transporter permease [Polyangiaceae bacterium LLY-WYZ-15_(1-7)]